MEKTLEKIIPFSVIDMKEEAYFGQVGVILFTETLKSNLKNCGIMKNQSDNIMVPQKDKFGHYSFSIPVEGDCLRKKLEIILNKSGLIKFEILFYNLSDGKWKSVEVRGFMPMNEFNKRFPDIIESLN